MNEVFKQSDTTASHRRIFFRLIDSSDGISGKVIVTAGVKVSLVKNGVGGTFTSTADIVAIDTVNQPGEYYLELTTSECDTLGQITGYLKPIGCLGARIQASIVSFDPYADRSAVAVADTFLDRVNAIETGLTPRQLFRLIGAVLLGRSSGLDTTTAVFRAAVSDTKIRVTATEDLSGNRSIVTTDAT